jgi:hypothetical protein
MGLRGATRCRRSAAPGAGSAGPGWRPGRSGRAA